MYKFFLFSPFILLKNLFKGIYLNEICKVIVRPATNGNYCVLPFFELTVYFAVLDDGYDMQNSSIISRGPIPMNLPSGLFIY